MKKLFLLLALTTLVLTTTSAQPRAVGARLGNTLDFSYQHSFKSNMLEFNAGLIGLWHGLKVDATYNWVFPIKAWKKSGYWNWYAGVGAGVGVNWTPNASSFSVGAAGKVGVEYNFTFPLQLFADFTPLLGPSFSKHGIGYDFMYLASSIGVGARYRF